MNAAKRLLPAPFSTSHASRICIIKPSSLGDVVQALPILSALRLRFPFAHISWIVSSAYSSLLTPIPVLDEVIQFPREQLRGQGMQAVAGYYEFIKKLGEKRFDLAIDLQGLFRSGMMAWATKAKRRLGLASAREGAAFFYSSIVNDLPIARSAVDRYWRIAEAFGVGDAPKEFPLHLTDEERRWAKERLSHLPRPLLAVQAGARWETKRWPAGHFAEAIERATARRPGGVILVGTHHDSRFADRIERDISAPTMNLCGATSLRHLAAVLERCDLLLTNDSGPMHLAAAVNTPTVSIFSCTDPRRAAPFGSGHRIVQTCVSCRASYLKKCDRMTCMNDLSPSRVLPVLMDAWDSPASRQLAASVQNPRAA